VSELWINRRRWRGQHIVTVTGTLNAGTRGPLVDALEEALEEDVGQIVLDLGDLESTDHSGLDAVLTAHLRASDQLKVLLIVPGPGSVQRVFEDAQVPFLYTSSRGVRGVGRGRSRGRRTSLSARPGSPDVRSHSGRTGPWNA
jgi:anti-anti-sigma regulatory factor